MNDADALVLYGHPFSSYTWKAEIGIAALGLDPEFRIIDGDHPEHAAFVQQQAGPHGLFPVLVDGENVLFEATTILEYVNNRFPSEIPLIPVEADAAVGMRMLDRVFDNYVMATMQIVVSEHLRDADNRDAARIGEARAKLRRSYAWLEGWLPYYQQPAGVITLVECAAAPSLFYADWVEPIGEEFPRLGRWRAQLLALSQVSRCVEAARPYRSGFPLGAPDRD